MRWPSSTLVPSIRTTMGTDTFRLAQAATMPRAATSHRRMPPKRFYQNPLHIGVVKEQSKGLLHLLLVGAAAYVKEIGGASPGPL